MQVQISLLRQLQEFDLEIQDIQARTSQLRESLDELTALHETLVESLDAQRGQLDDTRAMMRDKKIELEENLERYNQSKARLNQVSNTREYNALEKEMDALKKLRAQLEEEHDSLSEAIEGFEEDVSEKEEKTAEIANQMKEEEASIASESKDATDRIAKLSTERDRLKKDLPRDIVRRYNFIASRRPGRAVVAAMRGVCTGCNMLLPPQLYNELQIGQRMIQCATCQRILFYEEAPVEEEIDEP